MSNDLVPHRRRRFWHATQDCVVLYVNHILHRDWLWAISVASCSVIMGSQILLYGAQLCDAGASSLSLHFNKIS